MNASLYDHYKTLPNTELLIIARQTSDYTPEAIALAGQVLKERQVTEEDEREAAQYFDSLAVKTERQQALRVKANALLTTPLHRSEGFTASKWLPILLVVWGGQYLWSLYRSRGALYMLFTRFYGIVEVITIPDILLHFLALYLLYKRRRWGWTLLYAYSVLYVLTSFGTLYQWFKTPTQYRWNPGYTVESILIAVAFVLFLWRAEIAGYFNIPAWWKLRTTIAACIVALLIMIAVEIF